MFTRNIKQSVLLGKSGVRWMAEALPSAPLESSKLDYTALVRALKNVQFTPEEKKSEQILMNTGINTSNYMYKTRYEQKIEDVLMQAKDKNTLQKIFDNVLNTQAHMGKPEHRPRRAAFYTVLEKFSKSEVVAPVDRRESVLINTAQATVAALPLDVPKVTTTGAVKPTDVSKDPIVQTLFEGYTGNVVTGPDLAKSVSRAVAYTEGGWQKVYENVVGEKPGEKPDTKKFQTSLDQSVRILQQFGGGNAGMDALLMGRTQQYFTQIRQAVQRNGNRPFAIDLKGVDVSSLSPQTQTLLGAAATIVAAAATSGIVVAGHEADAVTADAFVKEFQADKEGGFWNGLGNALTWLKEAAMGRRASITLGASEKEGNVAKYREDIRAYTKAVMDTDYNGNPTLAQVYPTAKRLADQAGVDQNSDTFKRALIQSYILNEGFARQGTDWKMNIGLLFIGAGKDTITSATYATRESDYNKLERKVTKSEVPPNLLHDAGVTIERDPTSNKWIHTIPSAIKLPGDQNFMSVSISGYEPTVDNKYKIQSDKVQKFHFSEIGDKFYHVTFEDATDQPDASTQTASPSADVATQAAKEVRKFREKNDPKFDLEDAIFFAGHNVEFLPYLTAMAGQDREGARAALQSMLKGKYRTRARVLLKNLDNLDNTYTYGNTATRKLEKIRDPSQIRTQAVIAAEISLLEKKGITHHTPEDRFDLKAAPKQVSDSFKGQEMTLLVASTAKPAEGEHKNQAKDASKPEKGEYEKGILHRLDTMDGSFAIAGDPVVITDAEYKKQVIDATVKNVKSREHGISGQVESLNAWLASTRYLNKGAPLNVSQDNYIQYLNSGDIKDLKVPELTLQSGKETKIIEARARISGNLCLNRVNGIVYPLFDLKVGGNTISQPPKATATLDYSTPTTVSSVEVSQTALGLSTLGLLARFLKPEPGKSTITTEPGQVRVDGNNVLVNGESVGIVDTTKNTITLNGGGTFRLAPEQTIEQFLGSNGMISDISTVTVEQGSQGLKIILKNAAGLLAVFSAARSATE